MKSIAVGLGMVAGAAITLVAVNSMYPDVTRRMMRDGRRCVRDTKRMICDMGNQFAK